jgi:hypothetical protein
METLMQLKLKSSVSPRTAQTRKSEGRERSNQ